MRILFSKLSYGLVFFFFFFCFLWADGKTRTFQTILWKKQIVFRVKAPAWLPKGQIQFFAQKEGENRPEYCVCDLGFDQPEPEEKLCFIYSYSAPHKLYDTAHGSRSLGNPNPTIKQNTIKKTLNKLLLYSHTNQRSSYIKFFGLFCLVFIYVLVL